MIQPLLTMPPTEARHVLPPSCIFFTPRDQVIDVEMTILPQSISQRHPTRVPFDDGSHGTAMSLPPSDAVSPEPLADNHQLFDLRSGRSGQDI